MMPTAAQPRPPQRQLAQLESYEVPQKIPESSVSTCQPQSDSGNGNAPKSKGKNKSHPANNNNQKGKRNNWSGTKGTQQNRSSWGQAVVTATATQPPLPPTPNPHLPSSHFLGTFQQQHQKGFRGMRNNPPQSSYNTSKGTTHDTRGIHQGSGNDGMQQSNVWNGNIEGGGSQMHWPSSPDQSQYQNKFNNNNTNTNKSTHHTNHKQTSPFAHSFEDADTSHSSFSPGAQMSTLAVNGNGGTNSSISIINNNNNNNNTADLIQREGSLPRRDVDDSAQTLPGWMQSEVLSQLQPHQGQQQQQQQQQQQSAGTSLLQQNSYQLQQHLPSQVQHQQQHQQQQHFPTQTTTNNTQQSTGWPSQQVVIMQPGGVQQPGFAAVADTQQAQTTPGQQVMMVAGAAGVQPVMLVNGQGGNPQYAAFGQQVAPAQPYAASGQQLLYVMGGQQGGISPQLQFAAQSAIVNPNELSQQQYSSGAAISTDPTILPSMYGGTT